MKNKQKKNPRFFKFIYLLLFITCVLFTGAIYHLDVLPLKYFLLLLCGIIFIIGIFGLVLLNRKIKKFIKVFFTLLAIIIIGILGFISKSTFDVKDLLNNITQKVTYKTENYDVIVLDDSDYEKIEDLAKNKLGYLDNGSEGIKIAKRTLKESVTTTNEAYDDLADLSDDLKDEKVDAILVEETFIDILNEESDKFKNSTRVLYEFSVKVPERKESKKVNVTKEPFNVYITGIDTYGKITSVSRSDVNIVATINPNSEQILLTTIPRDYYVQLHGTTGYKDKLTHAGMYGVEKSVSTVEDLLDIKINYYLKANFSSVEKMVDEIGGITVHSDYNFVSEDNYRYYKGDNQMNGKRSLSFARERHSFQTGDIQRGKNQIYVIQGMADELMDISSVAKFNSLLNTLEGTFETNFSSDELSKIIKMQIDRNIKWDIQSNSLEGTGAKDYTYSTKRKAYVMKPDMASVATAKTKIDKVINSNK